MQNKKTSFEIINDLQTANKYIFVQDFVKAENILKQICQKHVDEYEVFFRRVEIASKSNRLEELLIDLSNQQKEKPKSTAIKLAFLLAKLKIYLQINRKTAQTQGAGTNMSFQFTNHEKVVRLPNKKLKLLRSVGIPDDFVKTSETFPLGSEQYRDPFYFEELLDIVFTFYKDNQENYAACYIAGCALESMGNVDEAILKWKKALSLNPESVCTLSILAELQQRGQIQSPTEDFCLKLESLDKYLVHGHIETHTDLYNHFILLCDFKNAISCLKILSDWISRQYGAIPVEIEVICLLGSMNAYKMDNNNIAYESSKNEVENIIISYKKSTSDLNHLIFIAELCEEHGLNALAKICYFSILTSKRIDNPNLVQVASHCVNNYPSEALLVNLKKSYENSKGNPEIRFNIVLCNLILKGIEAPSYMEIKAKIRKLISNNRSKEALKFLQELIVRFSEDPEIHYYLAEIYSRNGKISEAQTHFQLMYSLDTYNSEAILKYIYFLLRNKNYVSAINISKSMVALDILSHTQINEILWSLSAGYFAEEKYELSKQEISKSLTSEPWNISYITLNIRCCLHLTNSTSISDAFIMASKIEAFVINPETPYEDKKDKLIQNLIEYTSFCLRNGFFEIAWSFAKCVLIINKKLNEKISDLLSKTAAAYLPYTTIPQLLILLKKHSEIDISFFEITGCIARTYALTGQWQLVDEWLSMAQNVPSTDKMSQSKLFELEALSITMQGSNFKRAQNLLEAAIDCYDTPQQVPFETNILHGYLLVAQGNIADGIEKMQKGIQENNSIQSLYFFIKGLERAGVLSTIPKESIEQISHFLPLNTFEQKMIEEIFYTVGSKADIIPVGLAC